MCKLGIATSLHDYGKKTFVNIPGKLITSESYNAYV